MKIEIFKDYEEFKNRYDKSINGVSQQFLDDNSLTLDNVNLVDCVGCWNCQNCLNCINCEDCNYSVSLNNAIGSTGCTHCFITSLIKHFN